MLFMAVYPASTIVVRCKYKIVKRISKIICNLIFYVYICNVVKC